MADIRLPQAAPHAPVIPAPGVALRTAFGVCLDLSRWLRHLTFNQLHMDELKDLYAQNCARIIPRIDASLLNAVASATSFNQVVSVSGTNLQAYLCCGTGIGRKRPWIYIQDLSTMPTPLTWSTSLLAPFCWRSHWDVLLSNISGSS